LLVSLPSAVTAFILISEIRSYGITVSFECRHKVNRMFAHTICRTTNNDISEHFLQRNNKGFFDVWNTYKETLPETDIQT
jgi:hypothetical protein